MPNQAPNTVTGPQAGPQLTGPQITNPQGAPRVGPQVGPQVTPNLSTIHKVPSSSDRSQVANARNEIVPGDSGRTALSESERLDKIRREENEKAGGLLPGDTVVVLARASVMSVGAGGHVKITLEKTRPYDVKLSDLTFVSRVALPSPYGPLAGDVNHPAFAGQAYANQPGNPYPGPQQSGYPQQPSQNPSSIKGHTVIADS